MDNVCGICYQRNEELFHLNNSAVATCRSCIKSSVIEKSQYSTNMNSIRIPESDQSALNRNITNNQDVLDNIEQECPICGKYFARRYSFMNHVRNHSAERKHVCQYCQKAFTQAANLRNHERIHTNERPFTCSVCQKAFTQITNLNNHMRLHTGERPFQCPVEGCDKAFAQVTNLNNHSKTHQRDKSLNCDICHKTFFNYTHLNQHYRSHKLNTVAQAYQHMKLLNAPDITFGSSNVCDMPGCLSVFDSEQELKKHITHKHTPKPPRSMNKFISCYFDSCNRKFANSEDLSGHLAQIHGLSLLNKSEENHSSAEDCRNMDSCNTTGQIYGSFKCSCCNIYHSTQNDLRRHIDEIKLKSNQETESIVPNMKYKEITITSIKTGMKSNSNNWEGRVH